MRDGRADCARRAHARLEDRAAIGRGIATVDASPGEVDHAPAEYWLGVQIDTGDDVIGLVNVHRLQKQGFSEAVVRLLSILRIIQLGAIL